MIEVFEYNKDHVEKVALSNGVCHPKIFEWIDVFEPTEAELKRISDCTGIHIDDLKISLNEEERPKILDLEGPFSLIIFGAPSFEKDEITTTPVCIYTSKQHNLVVTIRNKDTKSLSRLKEGIETKKYLFEKGSSFFVYRLMDQVLTTYFSVLDDVDAKIDQIEDNVIKEPYIKTVRGIFETKKTLIYFTKSLAANREVISSIEKEYLSEIDKKSAKQFKTLYNDAVQLADLSSTYRDILTGTLDTYLSSVSNNLNNIMRKLTVGGSYILVPTLIASIYGMNFKFLPELDWKYGYIFALGTMALSIVVMHVYFKRKGLV